MRSSTLAVVALVLLLVLAVPSAGAAATRANSGEQATAAAKAKSKSKAKRKAAAKRKRCRKGYVLRTVKVKRKGKTVRVKRCRKQRAPKKKRTAPPTTPPPTPSPPAPPADDAARKLIESKLADTRFTNCAGGQDIITCPVETSYSHFPDGRFTYCRRSPGAPQPNDAVASTFQVQNPRTEQDGSWSFDSVVPNHGTYQWRVGADGQVTGTLQLAGEDRSSTLFTLQQLPGARDCHA